MSEKPVYDDADEKSLLDFYRKILVQYDTLLRRIRERKRKEADK